MNKSLQCNYPGKHVEFIDAESVVVHMHAHIQIFEFIIISV